MTRVRVLKRQWRPQSSCDWLLLKLINHQSSWPVSAMATYSATSAQQQRLIPVCRWSRPSVCAVCVLKGLSKKGSKHASKEKDKKDHKEKSRKK